MPSEEKTEKCLEDETAKYHQPFAPHHSEHKTTLDQKNVHLFVRNHEYKLAVLNSSRVTREVADALGAKY